MTENEKAPEVIGENPPEPGVLGVLEENELNTLTAINRGLQNAVMRIGNMEVQKQEIFYHMQALQEQSEMVKKNISKRLGIADNKAWNITQDGKVRELPQADNNG